MEHGSEREALLESGILIIRDNDKKSTKIYTRIIVILLLLISVPFILLPYIYYNRAESIFTVHLSDLDINFYKHCVILLSLDGFRSDYLTKYSDSLTNLGGLISSGAFARDGMFPIFPTTTFPNHVSLVTGVYAETHGMVNNEFYDIKLDKMFSYTNASQQLDTEWWWNPAEPIWKTMSKSGLKSAVYAWPGSEVPGYTPDYLIPYPKRGRKPKNSIDQILTWLDMPINLRASFIGVYLEYIDIAGHLYGTNSTGLSDALKEIDYAIRLLYDGLEKRQIDKLVNVIIVSDHGMTDTSLSYWIYLDLIIPLNMLKYVFYGPVAFLYPKLETEEMLIYSLLKQYSIKNHGIFTPYLRANLPHEYHFINNYRIAPIVVICTSPYYITASNCKRPPVGVHGYPVSNDPTMRSLFMASGERIASLDKTRSNGPLAVQLEPFGNLDIYPFMLELMATKDIKRNGGFHPTHRHNGTDFLIKRLLKS